MKPAIVAPGKSISYYLEYIHSIPVLTVEQEISLFISLGNGTTSAAQNIVLHNLRLVAYVARKYKSSVASLEELIQEGNVALMHAVKHFDVSFGVRFASYAMLHIKSAILDFIRHNYRIINVVTTKSHKKIFNNKSMFRSTKINKEETEYIAKTLNVPVDDVKEMHSKLTMKFESVIVDNDGEYDVLPIPDDRYDPSLIIEELDSESHQNNCIYSVLSELSERDRKIFTDRWLIEDKKTLKEVGHEHNISCERVRQLEDRILIKIRENIQK